MNREITNTEAQGLLAALGKLCVAYEAARKMLRGLGVTGMEGESPVLRQARDAMAAAMGKQ